MLACHLRRAWAPSPTPETRQPLDSPVAPFSAQPQRGPPGRPLRSASRPGDFRTCSTAWPPSPRQAITIGGHQIEKITTPIAVRRQAFAFFGARPDHPGADTTTAPGTVSPAQQGFPPGRQGFGQACASRGYLMVFVPPGATGMMPMRPAPPGASG